MKSSDQCSYHPKSSSQLLSSRSRPRNLWLPVTVGAMAIASFVSSSQSLNVITGVTSTVRATSTATATAAAHATATATATAHAASPAATAAATAPATDVVVGTSPAVGAPVEHGLNLLVHNLLDVSWLWTGALGSGQLGWLDTPMPTVVGAVGLFAFAAVVFFGLRAMDRRKAVSLAVVFGALVVIPVYELQRSGQRVGLNVQPRYLLPLLILLAGIAALPVIGRAVSFSRAQRVVLIVVLAVSNAAALYANMARYVQVPPRQSADLDHFIAWWWTVIVPSPLTVWAIGAVAFAGALAIIVGGTRATALSAHGEAVEVGTAL